MKNKMEQPKDLTDELRGDDAFWDANCINRTLPRFKRVFGIAVKRPEYCKQWSYYDYIDKVVDKVRDVLREKGTFVIVGFCNYKNDKRDEKKLVFDSRKHDKLPLEYLQQYSY